VTKEGGKKNLKMPHQAKRKTSGKVTRKKNGREKKKEAFENPAS